MPIQGQLDVTAQQEAQARFDKAYISTSEIAERLNIPAQTVHFAHKRGMLPGSISINGKTRYLWERDKIEPYLKSWEWSLKGRRGELKEGNA